MSKKFYISFDTKDMAPRLVAVTVELSKEVIRNEQRKMSVNLCDHPLYRDLERYVHANPSQPKQKV